VTDCGPRGGAALDSSGGDHCWSGIRREKSSSTTVGRAHQEVGSRRTIPKQVEERRFARDEAEEKRIRKEV
jgi:hypothetical protein